MKGFNRIIEIAVALAILMGALGGLLVFNQIAVLGRDRDWVIRSASVINASHKISNSIETAEDAERGYLMIGDSPDLAACRRAVAALPAEEARLTELVSDDPQQAAQVRSYISAVDRRRTLFNSVLAMVRAGNIGAAETMVRAREGGAAMSDIPARAAAVNQLETNLLAERTANILRAQEITLGIGVAVALLALAMLTVGLYVLARVNRRLTEAVEEAKAAEAARDSIDALNSAIFANVPDGLFVLKVEDGERFVLTDLNRAFCEAFRVTDEQVRGRDIAELLPNDAFGRMTAHYRRVLAAGRPVTSREHPRFPDGVRHWESVLAPVKNADGVADRIVGSIRDITDRVRSEERMQEAQRMEAIGQLTGGVAHDFNNLLQVIRGNLELLEGAVGDSERAKLRLKNAIFGAERAAQLTRQLLAFARRQPLAPQVVNLSRLVSDMTDLLRRTLGETIEVETVVAGGLWNTLADPAQVESAILNLALNARDAMPNGGRLTVEITNAELEEADVRQAPDVKAGPYVMLAVSDSGEGMSEETRARVFEPFFTTKGDGRGTGLGLSMVYGFVKQSSGHIQLHSEVGRGTTVKIYLPRTLRRESRPQPMGANADVQAGAHTILVVEDEDAVRAAAVSMLDELGYGRLEAADAGAALDIIERGARVDLVFSDVVMPGPLSVSEFAERLRDLRPDLPVLFTSGYTDSAFIRHARLEEGVNLISKPYARADLARKLAQMLRERVEV